MVKLTLPLLGLGGVGLAVTGGYMIFGKDSKVATTKVEATFKTKYSKAILGDSDALWSTKLETLKGSVNPTHEKLVDAKSKVIPSGTETQAKQLLIEGCKEIYDSKVEGSPYEVDFKTYCSKTIKDGITGTWISDAHTGNNTKWNQKLTNLNNHNEVTNGALDNILKTLKSQLTGGSDTTWDDPKRKSLKDWCDSSQKEVFMGETDSRFKHSKLYCLEG